MEVPELNNTITKLNNMLEGFNRLDEAKESVNLKTGYGTH